MNFVDSINVSSPVLRCIYSSFTGDTRDVTLSNN